MVRRRAIRTIGCCVEQVRYVLKIVSSRHLQIKIHVVFVHVACNASGCRDRVDSRQVQENRDESQKHSEELHWRPYKLSSMLATTSTAVARRSFHGGQKLIASGLNRSRKYSQPATNPPRIVFSGIQPTGIPHVSTTLHETSTRRLTMLSVARQLSRCSPQLGTAAEERWLKRPAHIFHRRLARSNFASRPSRAQQC